MFELTVTSKNGANVAVFSDRTRFPPRGLNGGGAGAGAMVLLNGKEIAPKGSARLKQGDILTAMSPGGGGFGTSEGA